MKDILVHTCCADCLLNTVQYLVENEQISSDSFLTVFFYNPNIHPRSEYLERLKALKEILPKVEEHIKTKLVIPNYSPKEYFSKVLPVSTKVGEKCIHCWELRLKALFDYANNVKINEIEKILDNDNKRSIYSSINKTRDFFNEVVKNILTRVYSSELIYEENVNQDFSRFFKRDAATFHTTLKESIVIDFRDKKNVNEWYCPNCNIFY